MDAPIYLDYNATTPVDPAVVETMVPFLFERFGNASSSHAYGLDAREALDRARRQVADLINARPGEIIFTGGGSETDNLAIKGSVFARLDAKPHVVCTAVEHPAVLATLRYLKRRFGVQSTVVPVDATGKASARDVEAVLQDNTVLVTVMHANNEVGTLQPVKEIAEITRARGMWLHVDAAQSAGKVRVDVVDLGADMLTLAGHKLYGPKGVGALYLRSGLMLDPLVHGSGQEWGLRAGTENVASIVGMGAAAELARLSLAHEEDRLARIRDRLQARLSELIPGALLNGHPVERLPNTVNMSLPGAIGQEVLAYTPDVAASTGSACHSGSIDPSAVLLAMGASRERALAAIRLSIGRWTTEQDVDRASRLLADGYSRAVGAREPAWGMPLENQLTSG